MTRRFTFGPASDDLRREHEQITELQAEVLDAIQPGMTVKSVTHRYNEQVTAIGHPPLPASGWIGHGIGIDLLERPSLDAIDETRMESGMVLTPEPWFLRGGMFVMTEETVLVTETGNRVLTQPVQAELGSVAG